MDPAAEELSAGLTPAGFDPQTGTQSLAVQVSPVYKDVAIVDSCRLGTRRPLGGCGSEEETPTHHCEYVHVFQLHNHYWDRHR